MKFLTNLPTKYVPTLPQGLHAFPAHKDGDPLEGYTSIYRDDENPPSPRDLDNFWDRYDLNQGSPTMIKVEELKVEELKAKLKEIKEIKNSLKNEGL